MYAFMSTLSITIFIFGFRRSERPDELLIYRSTMQFDGKTPPYSLRFPPFLSLAEARQASLTIVLRFAQCRADYAEWSPLYRAMHAAKEMMSMLPRFCL